MAVTACSRQRSLFDDHSRGIDPKAWSGSFNGIESTLQQLAPYVGKMKTGMVRALAERFSSPGEWILDPFCGSGVVPLEALLLGRKAIGNDLSPYAYYLTLGKLSAPPTLTVALSHASAVLSEIEADVPSFDVDSVPEFVRSFFHPKTLAEVVTASRILLKKREYFLLACLLGILHHVRPGFLSYPASHLTPYLRERLYPREDFPGMYAYRPLRPRLLAKVQRAYRRALVTQQWRAADYKVLRENTMALPLPDASVDLILTSPPYFGALDYARDNRLRLWFLGCEDWRALDRSLTASDRVYLPQMQDCLAQMNRVPKPGRHCVLVLGDVERDGKSRKTAEMIADLAGTTTDGELACQQIVADEVPDIRRSRRMTRTTKVEKVVVLRKRAVRVRALTHAVLVSDRPSKRKRPSRRG